MNFQQMATMMSLQQRMNAAVDPQWIDKKYPYLRAVVIEGGEAIEHHGWKWWKAQSMNEAQYAMELVDVLHFYLSEFLIKANEASGEQGEALCRVAADMAIKALVEENESAQIHFDGRDYSYADLGSIDRIELMIGLAVSRRISMRLLMDAWCCMVAPDGEDDIHPSERMFFRYVAKNVLNLFRQANGDKQGSYIKMWQLPGEEKAREDNEHLAEILSDLDASDPNLEARIMAGLEQRYRSISA